MSIKDHIVTTWYFIFSFTGSSPYSQETIVTHIHWNMSTKDQIISRNHRNSLIKNMALCTFVWSDNHKISIYKTQVQRMSLRWANFTVFIFQSSWCRHFTVQSLSMNTSLPINKRTLLPSACRGHFYPLLTTAKKSIKEINNSWF